MIYCPKCGVVAEQFDGNRQANHSCMTCGVIWAEFLDLMADDEKWPEIVRRDGHDIICPKCGLERSIFDKTKPRTTCPDCRVTYAASLIGPRPAETSVATINSKADSPNWSVMVFKDGKPIASKFQKMFESAGPYVIDKYRLDRLLSAEIIRDASTVSTHSTSEGATSTMTGSLAGRAVVGGMIAGPAGAIIGGGSANTRTKTNTTSTQITKVNVYMSLLFKGDASPVSIQVFEESAFQQILASVGQKEWSQSELDNAKEEHRRLLQRNYMQESKTKYLNAKVTPVFWWIFLGTAVPSFFIVNSFLSGIVITMFSIIFAAIVGSYSRSQLQKAYERDVNSIVRFNGLDSRLGLVIASMLVIWGAVYFLNPTEMQTRNKPVESSKPDTTRSSTNDADETRRKLQQDQTRAERDAMQPLIGQMCQQGNSDACRQYKDWEYMRQH